MTGPHFIDPAKHKQLVGTYHRMPQIQLQEVMHLAKLYPDEIKDIGYCRCVQRSLPGGSLKAFHAIISSAATPRPNRNKQPKKRAQRKVINQKHYLKQKNNTPIDQETPLLVVPAPRPHEIVLLTPNHPPDNNHNDCNDGATIASAAAQCKKIYNRRAYSKRKTTLPLR